MKKHIIKIINDTLKSPNGKWSRKSLTMFTSFVLAIVHGSYIVVAKEVNHYAIEVFFGFLLLAGGTSALTVYDKIKTRKDETSQEI